MSIEPSEPLPPMPLPETPPDFGFPWGSAHHEAHDTLWEHVAELERREADPFDSILVKNVVEIRGTEATLVLSPEDQSGAYPAITISQRSSGALDIELTSYSADHTHSTATILLQVNVATRRVFVGRASFPLDAAAVPVLSGIVDDPAGPPASAAVVARLIALLAEDGILKDATTLVQGD